MLIALGVANTPTTGQTPSGNVTLLLPETEFSPSEGPADVAGAWWVLHDSGAGIALTSTGIQVTDVPSCADDSPDAQPDRSASVPGAPNPIMLIRGVPGLEAGPVRSAFRDDGMTGEAARIELAWDGGPVIVRHLTQEPSGDQPGLHRVALTIGDRDVDLLEEQWQGDGHWRLRWMGDLNRDGYPDLLVDASYKYSVYTTRLFLSQGRTAYTEMATFSHTSC